MINKQLSVILAAVIFITSLSGISMNSFAAETKKSTVGGIIYSYSVNSKAATIISATYKDVNKQSKTVNLPSKLGGYALKTVGENATMLLNAETVVIPDSVETLESCSIGTMGKTKNIKLGKNLKTIKGDPFASCNRLASISVNSKNKNFIVYKSVLYNKSKTTLYKYPAAKIPASYTVFNSVKTVSNGAFSDSSKLKALTFGKNVKTIKADAVVRCKSINKFSVNKNNKYFSVKDGVLYNKKKTTLVLYPCAKNGASYTVLKGTTKISSRAFENASKLAEVKLPSTLTEIASRAFGNAYKLKTASLPSKLVKIGSNAFEGTALTKVVAPKTLESVGASAYECCKKLKSVDLSKSKLTKLNARVFADDQKISEIKFPKNLKTVTKGFITNTVITTLDLPVTLTVIPENTFIGCKNLKSVVVRGTKTDISKCMPREQYTAYRDDEDMDGYTAYRYKFKIIAPKGSEAEQFAIENSIEFVELQ